MNLLVSAYYENKKRLKTVSEKQTKKLIGESTPQAKNSVYDFLYHDIQRIGSFLSQFDKNGFLTSHTHTSKSSLGEGSSSTQDIKGGFDPIISSKISETNSINSSRANDSSQTYDPLWKNSLALLSYLDKMNMINRDLLHSNIGQFVLLSGKLFMFDLGFFQKVLQKQTSRQRFLDSFINDAANKATAEGDAQEAWELIISLPNSFQARLITENECSIWSTLSAAGLSISADDLLLKHGTSITGKWNILGILDALPDPSNINIDSSSLPIFQKTLADYSSHVRPRFGRDPSSYGITPLLIFREVTGN